MAENAKSGGIKPSFRTADACFFSDFSPNLPRISGRCGGRLPTLSSLRLQSVSVRRERPAPARRKGSALSGGNGPARRKGSAPSGEKCPALPGEKAPPLPMKNVLPCPTKKARPVRGRPSYRMLPAAAGAWWLSLFDVLVEPAEEFAVPYHRVLGLEDLVRFVLELDQTGRNALQTGGREGL